MKPTGFLSFTQSGQNVNEFFGRIRLQRDFLLGRKPGSMWRSRRSTLTSDPPSTSSASLTSSASSRVPSIRSFMRMRSRKMNSWMRRGGQDSNWKWVPDVLWRFDACLCSNMQAYLRRWSFFFHCVVMEQTISNISAFDGNCWSYSLLYLTLTLFSLKHVESVFLCCLLGLWPAAGCCSCKCDINRYQTWIRKYDAGCKWRIFVALFLFW